MDIQKTKKNNAFTLVELIVVIVILAILATIAFLSFSSQSGSARDSTRLSDISSIKKSVEMYNVNAWTYPTPDYAYSYTYSWGIIWNQWTIWDSAYKMLQKNLSKKVVDPLKWSEYDYSLASNKREYQVAWDFENPTSLERNFNPFAPSALTSQLSALWGTWVNVYISWNYNWVMLKVFTWSTYYFVPTPTLFWINSWTWNVVYDITFWSWKNLLPWVNNVAVFDSSKVFASTSTTWLTTDEVNNLMITIQSAYSTWNVSTPAVQAIVNATWSALVDLWVSIAKNNLGIATVPDTGNNPCGAATHSGYTIWPLSNWASTNIMKSVNYGTWDINASCSNWALSYWAENINCITNYVLQSGACVQDVCNWSAPDFSTVNWTQKAWVNWTHNAVSGQCTFVCQAWYYYSGWSCIAASAGNYVPSSWATSQTQCVAWTFQPATWQTSCTNASAWYYVAWVWATSQTAASAWNYVSSVWANAQTQCAAWTFQPATWQTSCIDSPVGYYVSSIWATAKTAASTWQYQDAIRQSSAKSCTNKPATNSAYTTSTALTANSCPWSCNATFHNEAGSCMSNTRTCPITNWAWSQTWNWSSWNACLPTGCDSWFVNNWTSCELPSPWSWDATSWFIHSWATPTSCNNLLTNSTFKAWTSTPWNWTKFVNWAYRIDPDWAWWLAAKMMYCEMTSDSWGWTLITRWWNRDSRFCTADWFWSPSPSSPYSIWTSYMPFNSRYFRTWYDGTNFSVTVGAMTASSDADYCFKLVWTGTSWILDATHRDKVYITKPNGSWSCYWFYYGWNCNDHSNEWWIYVK